LHDVVVWSGASTGQCFYSHKGEDLDFTPEGFGTIEMFPLVGTVVRWRSDRSTSCFDDLEAREAAEDEEAESVALEKDDGHFMQPVEYSERGESARGCPKHSLYDQDVNDELPHHWLGGNRHQKNSLRPDD
jgi:hypothetical protein